MTKKYRLLKELPGKKVWTIFEWGSGFLEVGNEIKIFFTYKDINWLIDNGWIEEIVEKKTLKEKFRDQYHKIQCYQNGEESYVEILVEIAKAHFLEIAIKNKFLNTQDSYDYERGIEDYKKAIKDAE